LIHFSDFLRPDRIKLSIAATRKREAIKEVANILDNALEIRDKERFLKEIFERESVEATAIGNGVAVPHARTDAVTDLVIAVGRSQAGVDFGSMDGKPVRLVFVMGTPRANVTNYLKILAQLSRVVRSPGCLDKTMAADTAQEIVDIFRALEEP
jgi:fructose-specific phosphotransferase system IIA component